MDGALPWVLAAAGVLAIVGAWQDWDWFMNSRKAALWVRLFGRGGARVFYAVLGFAIVGLGVALAAGAPSR